MANMTSESLRITTLYRSTTEYTRRDKGNDTPPSHIHSTTSATVIITKCHCAREASDYSLAKELAYIFTFSSALRTQKLFSTSHTTRDLHLSE